jgi:MFS family permease
MVTFVAVPHELYALTGSPLQVGLLSICDAVPLLLFSALGGDDRRSSRPPQARPQSGDRPDGVSGLLAANAFAPTPQVWALYVLAAVATSLWAIGAPALRALMPGLVTQEQLAASQALQSIYANTGAIVGPALGGLLIAAAGVGATYAIDTSLRFSIVSGGVACAVGAVAILAAVPSLFRYDSSSHVPVSETGGVPDE